MTELIDISPTLNKVNKLKKYVAESSTYINKTIQFLKRTRQNLDIMTENFNKSEMKYKSLDQMFLTSIPQINYLQIDMHEQKQHDYIPERVKELDEKMKMISIKFKETEEEISGKKAHLEGKLNRMEKIHSDMSIKSREVNEWASTFEHKSRMNSSGLKEVPKTQEVTNLLSKWSKFKTLTTKFIHDSTCLTKRMCGKVKSEHLKLNKKIKLLRKELEQLIRAKNKLNTILEGPQETKDRQEENQELRKSLQKMKEQFELQFQELSDKLTKEKEEKSRSLQRKSEKLLLVAVAKRDELLREKDEEIERLRRELKNAQEQTKAKLVKLEDLQEFNAAIMKEKDIEIGKLREFTREIDTTLNRISEVNNSQNADDFQVKEEDGLEEMKEVSIEKSRSSLREVSNFRSVNGKRNFGTLLTNYEEEFGIKSTSKVLASAGKNLNSGKENVDEDLGVCDQVMKKIKQ